MRIDRYHKKKSDRINQRFNLISTLTLVAILTGILLFFTNQKQNQLVLASYCGDFGIYGKTLILMKDSTFRFNYYGCSQSDGFVAGSWSQRGQIINLIPVQEDINLSNHYLVSSHDLTPIGDSDEDKFTLCEYYQDTWERHAGNRLNR